MNKTQCNISQCTFPTKDRYACINCNKPCIMVGKHCQIAKVRIAMDCSFKVAYAMLTGNDDFVDSATKQKYFSWRQAGEPMPQDYQI